VANQKSAGAVTAILAGGFAAGVLDIVYAFVALGARRGLSPLRVLQSVASGLLGKEAFEGGVPAGVLGLVCQFVIAIGAAAVYYLAARRLALLRERPLLAGALFGILVYLFMNFVVIPLSAAPFKLSYPPSVLVEGFVSHALLVGIPIALAIRRFAFR
jgi:hypothetical protein